jgi:hypothetical protein
VTLGLVRQPTYQVSQERFSILGDALELLQSNARQTLAIHAPLERREQGMSRALLLLH